MKIDPQIYLLGALALLHIWTLIGLLIWLGCYGESRPKYRVKWFFVTLLCGPAAYIIAAWSLSGHRTVIVQSKTILAEPWELPEQKWRN